MRTKVRLSEPRRVNVRAACGMTPIFTLPLRSRSSGRVARETSGEGFCKSGEIWGTIDVGCTSPPRPRAPMRSVGLRPTLPQAGGLVRPRRVSVWAACGMAPIFTLPLRSRSSGRVARETSGEGCCKSGAKDNNALLSRSERRLGGGDQRRSIKTKTLHGCLA
jgi:CelD/BcsL family acetyltransferase involved in cellulose biosynthesis